MLTEINPKSLPTRRAFLREAAVATLLPRIAMGGQVLHRPEEIQDLSKTLMMPFDELDLESLKRDFRETINKKISTPGWRKNHEGWMNLNGSLKNNPELARETYLSQLSLLIRFKELDKREKVLLLQEKSIEEFEKSYLEKKTPKELAALQEEQDKIDIARQKLINETITNLKARKENNCFYFLPSELDLGAGPLLQVQSAENSSRRNIDGKIIKPESNESKILGTAKPYELVSPKLFSYYLSSLKAPV